MRGEIQISDQEEILCCQAGDTLQQVPQGELWGPNSGSVQDQAGSGLEQGLIKPEQGKHGLVGGVPVPDRQGRTQ